MSASRLAAFLGAGAAVLLACGGDDPCDSVAGPAVVATVDLTPDDPAVALGQTLQLVAVPRSACGNRVDDAQVAWSSSEPDIASVSPTGMVSGAALGAAGSLSLAGDAPPLPPELKPALEKLEPYFTAADDFRDVSRGKPVPHSLSDAKKREVGLTRDTWTLQIINDREHPATIDHERTDENEMSFTAFVLP